MQRAVGPDLYSVVALYLADTIRNKPIAGEVFLGNCRSCLDRGGPLVADERNFDAARISRRNVVARSETVTSAMLLGVVLPRFATGVSSIYFPRENLQNQIYLLWYFCDLSRRRDRPKQVYRR